MAYSDHMGCIIVELNVQIDHVHVLVMIPPNVMVCDYVGTVKGRTAIRLFSKYPKLRTKPYWGNHFWSEGYCADTVGLNAEQIRKYVKYQDEKDIYFNNR